MALTILLHEFAPLLVYRLQSLVQVLLPPFDSLHCFRNIVKDKQLLYEVLHEAVDQQALN